MSSLLRDGYLPGATPLHRLPAGTSLAALFVAGLVIVLTRGPVAAVVALVVAVCLLASTGVGMRRVLATLRGPWLVVLLLGGWLAWQQGTERAVATVGDLLALIVLSAALTTTTPAEEMLDALSRGLRPLRRIGVRSDSVALAFSLVLRALPTTLALADETRDAARARGLQRDPRARLVPLVLRVVAHAHATGDALHARGLGDD